MSKTSKILINDKITQCEVILEKLGNGDLLYEIKEVKQLMDKDFCLMYSCELNQIEKPICPIDLCSSKIQFDLLINYVDEEAETDEELINEIKSIKRVYEGLL